ncbi:T9SS type A sorting domain-containing protein [Rhodoflexus sp.]
MLSEKSDDNWLYVSNQVKVSNIFPNPASDVASFNYVFYDSQTNVKVVIRNVLGSVVGEYTLSPQELQLTIPVDRFIPGVYFYTLWVNDKSIATKKLIVKR